MSIGGEAHRLSQGEPAEVQPIQSLLTGGHNVQHPDMSTTSDRTALLCGAFLLNHTAFNPLVSALPSLMGTSLSRAGELTTICPVSRV